MGLRGPPSPRAIPPRRRSPPRCDFINRCKVHEIRLYRFVFGLDVEIEGAGFMVAIYIALVAVMLLFDFVLKRMTLIYERRVRPVIFKNK